LLPPRSPFLASSMRLLLVGVLATTCAAFKTVPPSARYAGAAPRAAVTACAEPSTAGLSRRTLVAAAAFPTFLAQRAVAEQTLVTRQQAYTRYVPRIERGRDYWANGVRKAVAASDWPTLVSAIEKKGSVDRIFGPMQLWASSFSGKTISEKTLAMNGAVDELKEAVRFLNIAAIGTEKGGGFFGFGGQKKIDESKRKQLASAAYQKGVAAINKYIEIGNDGLGLQFATLDTID